MRRTGSIVPVWKEREMKVKIILDGRVRRIVECEMGEKQQKKMKR